MGKLTEVLEAGLSHLVTILLGDVIRDRTDKHGEFILFLFLPNSLMIFLTQSHYCCRWIFGYVKDKNLCFLPEDLC